MVVLTKVCEDYDFTQVRNDYNDWAEWYEEDMETWLYQAPDKVAKRLSSYFKPGTKLIECGCGTGLNRKLYPHTAYFGVDASHHMLQEANGFQKVNGDITKLPFPDNSFNASLCVGVLEYIKDKQPALEEMTRVVKPKGIIAFTISCTKVESLYPLPKEQIEDLLTTTNIKPLEMYKFLAFKRDGVAPRYFWCTIGQNH